MSSINPNAIDVTQPPATAPSTAGMRSVIAAIKAQFAAALADITALEGAVGSSLVYSRIVQSEALDQAAEVMVADYYTIPAGDLVEGEVITLRVVITLSNPAFESFTFRVRLGGLAGDILCQHATGTAATREYQVRLVVRVIGAPGSVHVMAGQTLAASGAMAPVAAVITPDTTGDLDLVVTGEWATIVGGPSAHIEQQAVWREAP